MSKSGVSSGLPGKKVYDLHADWGITPMLYFSVNLLRMALHMIQ